MPNPTTIMDMASAFYRSQVLFAASDLNIFGALAELESASAEDLAAHCATSERGMRLLLDACVAVGLLSKTGDAYGNSAEAAAFLVPGSPGDLSRAIRYNRDVYEAWGRLQTMVRTGEPVERPQTHLGDDPERTRTFVESMHARARAIGQAVIPALDLSGCARLLDVGGGPGTYSVMLAQQYPELECTVLDLPGVTAVAEELIEQQGASDRVKTRAGDYRTAPFPGENDAILLFGMMHQESPESIRAILKKSYAALNPGGTVYVMDIMTDATHASPPFSALFAVNMALTTESGWVFSDRELENWMREAGFEQFHITALPAPMPHWLAAARMPTPQS